MHVFNDSKKEWKAKKNEEKRQKKKKALAKAEAARNK